MKLVLPLIALFMVLGLSQRALTWRVQTMMFAGILMIALAFFLTWNY